MKKIILVFSFVSCGLLSFKSVNENILEFVHPKIQGTKISLISKDLIIYKSNWNGEDYYYFMKGKSFEGCVCFYKLNDQQKISFVDSAKASPNEQDVSSLYAYLLFKSISWDKQGEENESSWGKSTDDFMFRQYDVKTSLTQYPQKIMYGYCMFNEDIFISIKLNTSGKSVCSSMDSIEMRNVLRTLAKSK